MDFLCKLLQKTDDGFEISPATAVAAADIKFVLGLKPEKVNKILVAGIPMMAAVAADDEHVAQRLYNESNNPQRSRTKHRKYAVKDYFMIFGDKGRPLTQAVAGQTGASEGDVNNVLGLFLPTFIDAIEEEHPQGEAALAGVFRADAAEARRDMPAVEEMALRMAL